MWSSDRNTQAGGVGLSVKLTVHSEGSYHAMISEGDRPQHGVETLTSNTTELKYAGTGSHESVIENKTFT